MPASRSITRAAYVASVLVLGLGVAFGLVAVHQLRVTTEQLQSVTSAHGDVVLRIGGLQLEAERMARAVRGYLLTGNAAVLAEAREASSAFVRGSDELRPLLEETSARNALEEVARLHARYDAALQTVLDVGGPGSRAAAAAFEQDARDLGRALRDGLLRLAQTESEAYLTAKREATADASRGARALAAVALLALGSAIALTLVTVRAVVRLGRARQELEAVNAKLLAANRELDAFAGRTAHDLRNVLAPVRLVSAHLRAASRSEAAARDAAARLERLAARSDRLITALLAFARSGRAADPDATASVQAVLAEVREELAPAISEVGAHVRFDLQDGVVACSPELLHVVLANVLGNSVKYLRGRPRREVRVTVTGDRLQCRIEVADTGPGIAPELRDRVFQPFFRVPGSGVDGTGIGLATVARVVEAHGGRIALESEVGTGTTVTVSLPARPVTAAATPPPIEPRRPGERPTRSGP